MKKSIYSLVLFEELVQELDDIAQEQEVSRSQLMNNILAQYLGRLTPELRILSILEKLKDRLEGEFKDISIKKQTSLCFDLTLNYKYHPKIYFELDFKGDGKNRFAVLKISSRSKSKALAKKLTDFTDLISQLDKKYSFLKDFKLVSKFPFIFVREFRISGQILNDPNSVSDFLCSYILMLKQALHVYFSKRSIQSLSELEVIFDFYFKPMKLQLSKQSSLELVR